jgi:ribosome modulation factor
MSKPSRPTVPTPRDIGAAAAFRGLQVDANPYADANDRAQWLEGWNDTINSHAIARRKAELKGGSE